MLEKLLMKIANWCDRKKRTLYITGTTPDDVYLIRYYVVNYNWLKIYIHIFLRSDRDDPHDHPWNFWTLIVRGSYTEAKYDFANNGSYLLHNATRSLTASRWVKRNATDVHKVILDRSYSLKEKDQAPMTLFFAGPVIRDWGFVQNGKWIFWKTYLGLPEDAKAR